MFILQYTFDVINVVYSNWSLNPQLQIQRKRVFCKMSFDRILIISLEGGGRERMDFFIKSSDLILSPFKKSVNLTDKKI